jgi:hypothetical protein
VGMIARTVSWRVAEALSVHLAGATDMAIEEIVRRRGQSIKNSVEDERVLHPEFTPTDLARSLVYQRSNVSAIAGAVSSLPGAFPGIGSGAEIGAALADTAALIYSQVALTLAVAAAFDHDLGAHDARAADVRIVLALDVGAAKFGERGIVEFADGGTLDPHDPELSEELTRELGVMVVQRTVRRRARTLLGREIPFGVGVAIGAGANFKVMRHTGRTALRYFDFTATGTGRA